MTEIQTEVVDISGIQQNRSFEADIIVGDIPSENFSTEKVSVSIQVGEKKINQRFSAIPIEVVGTSMLYSVKPKVASIVIQGTPGILNFIATSDLRAFLDARDLVPGRYDKKIQVQIPPDTALIETAPRDASIEIYPDRRSN